MSASPASEWQRRPSGLYVRGEGARLRRYGEEFIVQTKGRWAGKKLEHEVWECKFLDELFLRREPKAPPARTAADKGKFAGDRVYDRALLGIARKNGKSTLSSELALYGLMATGEHSPEVYAAAAAKDQARIVFGQSKQFVEASPKLMDWLTPQQSAILCKSNLGIFRVLSADGGLQMGLNPSMVVIDELHEHKKRDLWDALTSADLARENPLVIAITTAGFDRESVCFEQYQLGMDLRNEGGLEAMRREGFLFWWYEVPNEIDGVPVDYRDQSLWHLANPSSWITNDRLERYQKRMPENVFRRLHLNQWTEAEDAWVRAWEWDKLRGRPKWVPGAPTWIGVDVAYRRDCAAIVWVQWHDNKLHIGCHILDPTDDPTFGISEVRGAVAKWAQAMPRTEEISFDPFMFMESAEILMERGLPMVEYDQSAAYMGPASENLYTLIQEGRLVHDGNPVLRAHILHTVAGQTERGGYRISKRKSLERIDGCVALAMAADRAVTMRYEKKPSGTVHIY